MVGEEAISLTERPIEQLGPEVPPLIRSGRHYDHAPIAEAVLEIKCTLPEGVSLDDLLQCVDRDEFPVADQAVSVEGRIDLSDDGQIRSAARGQVLGHVFRRADGNRVVQARLDGFSFSWLPPYDRWEAFLSEAEAHWLRYRRAVRPTKAVRLGVRFINKIDVPSPQIEIKDYLRMSADVPAYLPQGIAGYFVQVQIPLSHYDCSATITTTLVPPPNDDSTSLLLDIDTWQMVEISLTDDVEAEGVAARLATMRKAKNYVFESCITDATRGLIK
jgi:uncharacterized protein (TIGR04255 family)